MAREKIKASEVQEESKNVSTSEEEVVTITLDEYLKSNHVNMGLIASFTYEAKQVSNGFAPRSEAEWKEAFRAQSCRAYA